MTDFACTGYAPTSSHLPKDKKTHFCHDAFGPWTNGYVIHSSEEQEMKTKGGKDKECNGDRDAEEEDISGGK